MSFFSSSSSYLLYLVLLSLSFSIQYPINASASFTNGRENVQCMPFITLIEQPCKLHLIKDYFTLVQHLNLDVVTKHIDEIENGYGTVKSKYLLVNGSHKADFSLLESKLRVKRFDQRNKRQHRDRPSLSTSQGALLCMATERCRGKSFKQDKEILRGR